MIAENSLTKTTAALDTAQKLVDELKRVNPASALTISAEIAREREEAHRLAAFEGGLRLSEPWVPAFAGMTTGAQ